jgi:methionine-rich copper-binding protein CopC
MPLPWPAHAHSERRGAGPAAGARPAEPPVERRLVFNEPVPVMRIERRATSAGGHPIRGSVGFVLPDRPAP